MARRNFVEVPYQYGDGRFGTAIGQTRNGIEELVQLVGLMEYDPVSGLWAPPGVHPNPARFRVDAQLSGRLEPQVTTLLRDTPLSASQAYIQSPVIDTQEYVFPNGSKGALSISGLAITDKQGTLYLEASNDGTSWVRVAAVAANNSGIARLRRTNIFTRYVRFRYVNGPDAQTSFKLWQTLWQTTDGQGDEYGQGADVFTRFGALAVSVRETVMDIRSALELQELVVAVQGSGSRVYVAAYKDDGTLVHFGWRLKAGISEASAIALGAPSYIQTLFDFPTVEGAGATDFYAVLKRPYTFAKGVRIQVENLGTDVINVGVVALCRLL